MGATLPLQKPLSSSSASLIKPANFRKANGTRKAQTHTKARKGCSMRETRRPKQRSLGGKDRRDRRGDPKSAPPTNQKTGIDASVGRGGCGGERDEEGNQNGGARFRQPTLPDSSRRPTHGVNGGDRPEEKTAAAAAVYGTFVAAGTGLRGDSHTHTHPHSLLHDGVYGQRGESGCAL